MTRINIGIQPIYLADWHLIAEINEIPRVLEVYKNRIDKNMNFNDIPKSFTLGEGHVLFFLDKMEFIKKRYLSLIKEGRDRNLSQHFADIGSRIHPSFIREEHFNDYIPTQLDKQTVLKRIIDRIRESDKLPYYNHKAWDKEIFIKAMIDKLGEPLKEQQLKLF
jgi:deoxyribonuclease (pyrimidine dimer)